MEFFWNFASISVRKLKNEGVQLKRTCHFHGRGRTKTPTGMNNLEKRYADHLRTLQLVGEIHSFSFERHNLKLADKTYYKPDFGATRS